MKGTVNNNDDSSLLHSSCTAPSNSISENQWQVTKKKSKKITVKSKPSYSLLKSHNCSSSHHSDTHGRVQGLKASETTSKCTTDTVQDTKECCKAFNMALETGSKPHPAVKYHTRRKSNFSGKFLSMVTVRVHCFILFACRHIHRSCTFSSSSSVSDSKI